MAHTALATAELLATMLGGRSVLRQEIHTPLQMTRLVQSGLPTGSVEYVIKRGAATSLEIEHIVIPRRTLARRKKRKEALSRDESDRLARLARVIAEAETTLGDPAKAHRWLRKPNRALNAAMPMELLDTDGGALLVEQVLGRIAYGVYS